MKFGENLHDENSRSFLFWSFIFSSSARLSFEMAPYGFIIFVSLVLKIRNSWIYCIFQKSLNLTLDVLFIWLLPNFGTNTELTRAQPSVSVSWQKKNGIKPGNHEFVFGFVYSRTKISTIYIIWVQSIFFSTTRNVLEIVFWWKWATWRPTLHRSSNRQINYFTEKKW